MKGRLALLLISGIVSYPLQASPDFEHYVTGLKQEALAAGISPATVTAAFADIHLIEVAIRHDKISRNLNRPSPLIFLAPCRNGKSIKPNGYIVSICRCSQK